MAQKEVFANPTVKRVIMQIRFPNLFSMEKMIGDYQTKIMDKFPDSQLLFERNMLLTDVRPGAKLPVLDDDQASIGIKKIWRFRDDKGVELNVHTDSLDMSSTLHKTYDNPDGEYKFRDTIKYAIDNFLSTVKIPKLNRIGLRYIDECPVNKKTTAEFKKWYKTTFPLDRFSFEDAVDLNFSCRVKKGEYYLRFCESFQDSNGVLKYTLDYDGSANNIPSENYLDITDKLHELISEEFDSSIDTPVKEYMRQGE